MIKMKHELVQCLKCFCPQDLLMTTSPETCTIQIVGTSNEYTMTITFKNGPPNDAIPNHPIFLVFIPTIIYNLSEDMLYHNV